MRCLLTRPQQHTVEVNERNYEKQREKIFPNDKFLEKFSKIVKDKYQVQLQKDYLGLNPGLAILENLTATIRGMVEIKQAQRDRNLNANIAIAIKHGQMIEVGTHDKLMALVPQGGSQKSKVKRNTA